MSDRPPSKGYGVGRRPAVVVRISPVDRSCLKLLTTPAAIRSIVPGYLLAMPGALAPVSFSVSFTAVRDSSYPGRSRRLPALIALPDLPELRPQNLQAGGRRFETCRAHHWWPGQTAVTAAWSAAAWGLDTGALVAAERRGRALCALHDQALVVVIALRYRAAVVTSHLRSGRHRTIGHLVGTRRSHPSDLVNLCHWVLPTPRCAPPT